MDSLRDVRALLFDVFGTLVDWRSSIAREARQILAPHGGKARKIGNSELRIIDLPADAPVGTNFREYLGPGDTVFDVEVTPNRPDWLTDPEHWQSVTRAVEEGLSHGYRRAHKHTDHPEEETVKETMRQEIMNALCQVVEFEE